jgi:transketolase
MDRKEGFEMDGIGEDLFFFKRTYLGILQRFSKKRLFPVSEATFRLINTRLQGHPTTHDNLPGVRIASGSLGQGLSVAIELHKQKKLNNDNHLVYTLHGDGELQEGQNWEAIMYALLKK